MLAVASLLSGGVTPSSSASGTTSPSGTATPGVPGDTTQAGSAPLRGGGGAIWKTGAFVASSSVAVVVAKLLMLVCTGVLIGRRRDIGH